MTYISRWRMAKAYPLLAIQVYHSTGLAMPSGFPISAPFETPQVEVDWLKKKTGHPGAITVLG